MPYTLKVQCDNKDRKDIEFVGCVQRGVIILCPNWSLSCCPAAAQPQQWPTTVAGCDVIHVMWHRFSSWVALASQQVKRGKKKILSERAQETKIKPKSRRPPRNHFVFNRNGRKSVKSDRFLFSPRPAVMQPPPAAPRPWSCSWRAEQDAAFFSP